MIMSEKYASHPMGPIYLAFLAGAALGAAVIALGKAKTDPKLREGVDGPAPRGHHRAGDMAGKLSMPRVNARERVGVAVGGPEPRVRVSVNNLPG